MDILELVPPKQLSFSVPGDCDRTLTLTNLTLHSVLVLLMPSHPYELRLSNSCFLLQAFEEKQVKITLNWNQEGLNLSQAKIRLLYREIEEQGLVEELASNITSCEFTNHVEDLDVCVDLDLKASDFLQYRTVDVAGKTVNEATYKEEEKNYYLMRRVSHLDRAPERQAEINSDEVLKNRILCYLQELSGLISIHPCQDSSFLVQLNCPAGLCQFATFSIASQTYTYALSRIVAYGRPCEHASLLALDQQCSTVKEQKLREVSLQKQEGAVEAERGEREQRKDQRKLLLKQTFLGREADRPRFRKRNRSEEKIIEHSPEAEEEDEAQLFREQVRQLNKMKVQAPELRAEKEHRVERKPIKETTIEFTQKILNLFVEETAGKTDVYVILRDCVRCLVVGHPEAQRVIKFDPMYEEHVHMPCPVDKHQDELIFGNETILYWVNLTSGESEWKYVQRKYIYALAVIEELSLVAVGGKNFSKLSYFGKETTRSNLKLYSCSSNDKHEHLFTYDMPGHQMGNIVNMAYISTPPHSTKLLLVHTLNASSNSSFHFLRVKAFNKVEVFGQMDLEELGILNLIRFRHNRQSGRVVCMQVLGETQIDSFKRLKLRCQYEKVEVSTEGFKLPLKKYVCFQLGGGGGDDREWMSLIDENGGLYIYDLSSGKSDLVELNRFDIRQVFSTDNEKYLIICTEGTIVMRQTSR